MSEPSPAQETGAGAYAGLGLFVATLWLAVDQAQKYWALNILDMIEGQTWHVFPGLDFTLIWNRGISYGLFQQGSEIGRWALVGFRLAATVAMIIWLTRMTGRLGAVALGCIIGGALGNAIDGVAYGAVADFFHLYYGQYDWYVFNIADVAIVAGVVLLLYEAVRGSGHQGRAV